MRARLAAMLAGCLLMGALGAGPALAQENLPPDGFHDTTEGSVGELDCFATGWAVDPDSPATRLDVRILADGSQVATTVANLFRQDLVDAGVSPDGNASFEIELWGLVEPDVAHEITAQAADAQTGEWVDLGATPKTLTCSDVNYLPDGTHDAAEGDAGPTGCVAAGWATDPDDRYTDLNIRILSDGAPVAAGVADEFRQDLLDAGVSPDGLSAFTIGLWGLVPLNEPHAITAQAQDAETGQWADLAGTPKTLTCVAPTAMTPNPKTAYYTVECAERGTLFVEAVFFASGNEVGGSTSAFHVIGDNRVLIAYTGGTDKNADDYCTFGWTGGWEPNAPWNGTFDAVVFVTPKKK